MLKNMIVEPTITTQVAKPLLSLNMQGLDKLFPGFQPGDFAVLYGSPSVISLTSLLCVRAQLPPQLGGLGSNVIFVDGAVTFRLYNIARLAQLHQLNPEKVLEKIFISRAFTAYQLVSLIMEKLEETVKTYNAKVVIISDIASFFLDTDVPAEEAQKVYSQIICYLHDFASKHQIVVIATYLPYENSRRNSILQETTFHSASTVLRFTKTQYTKQIALEKHPTYNLGIAQLPSKNRPIPLTDFMGVSSG